MSCYILYNDHDSQWVIIIEQPREDGRNFSNVTSEAIKYLTEERDRSNEGTSGSNRGRKTEKSVAGTGNFERTDAGRP